MSADEFDRSAVRLVRAASANLADSPTAAISLPAPGRCRTRVDGHRCGHAKDAHLQVGFHAGERHRCACGCRAYTSPFEMVIVALCALAIALPIVAVIWFVLVPALVEMLT